LCLRPGRVDTISSIVKDVLLPRIVERCREKISQIFIGHYSRPFRDWYANIDKSNPLEDAVGRPDPRLDWLDRGLQTINSCSGDDVSILSDSSYVGSILYASGIMSMFGDILESQWAVYNSKTQVIDDEDDDDCKFFGPVEMKKSPIYRFFRKLERYYVACRTVTLEVVHLVRSNFAIKIIVATVPILTTTSTPAEQNEYPTCDEFFTKCLKIDVKTLDPKKVDSLRESWLKSRESDNLFLHAEMQMALFYALNPQLYPIEGFIGVSKNCCWCCDFVLK
jgi:hypothetical protein